MTTVKKKPKAWEPLQLTESTNPEVFAANGIRPPDRVYGNDLYSVFVRDFEGGVSHISFHRRNRAPVHDWRHFQAIKNEVAGPERLAIEVYPPESLLVDSSNEYHLWVLPIGAEESFPFLIRSQPDYDPVKTQEEIKAELGADTKARQRDWQPGIPTGKGIPRSKQEGEQK
jgi:hypothetical protein